MLFNNLKTQQKNILLNLYFPKFNSLANKNIALNGTIDKVVNSKTIFLHLEWSEKEIKKLKFKSNKKVFGGGIPYINNSF